MTSSTLDDLRRDIDRVDEVLVRLLNERARCVCEVGRLKKEGGLDVYQPEREKEVLDPSKGTYASTGMPQQNAEFAQYSDSIRDLTPRAEVLPEGSTPFPVKYVARQEVMFFNFGSYGHQLISEFYGAGGKIVI